MQKIPALPGIACLLIALACQPGTTAQSPAKDMAVGGRCEDCALNEAGMPASLSWQTTMAGPTEPGERLTISGTIFKKDGRSPAADVILYLYHTDASGLYSPAKGQEQAREHGHLRGWVKTGADGRYRFQTILPAHYPNSRAPRHIHPTIKEPGFTAYYLDNYLFENDPNMNEEERNRAQKRGGSGIIRIEKNKEGSWEGKRDIVLGLNIPGYPD